MANSLHYVNDQRQFLTGLKKNFKMSMFLLIEYDTTLSNRWVPYPLSFQLAKDLFKQLGFEVEKINERPSTLNPKGIYSAVFYK
jgi:hypothetical protein